MKKRIINIKDLILKLSYKARKREMFESQDDIKKFMLLLSQVPVEDIRIREKCKWFSEGHYSILSEYAGELKLFVDDLINMKEFSSYSFQLIELRKVLARFFYH